MRISLIQLILLALVFIVLFQSRFSLIKSFYQLVDNFFKKNKKKNSTKDKIDN